MNSQQPLLVFLHIPKTAGSSVHSILEQHFNPWRVFSIRKPMERSLAILENLSLEKRQRFELVKGHTPYGLKDLFPGRKLRYFTIIREPVSRVFSEYRWVRFNPRSLKHAEAAERNLSLPDYLESDWCLDNAQCRWLSGKEFLDKKRPFTEIDFQQLIERLEREFISIGTTDQFDQSMQYLGMKLGWSRICYSVQNIGKLGSKTTKFEFDNDKDYITKCNLYDIQLHRWAKQNIQYQCDQFSDNFPCVSRISNPFYFAFERTLYVYARVIWKARRYW